MKASRILVIALALVLISSVGVLAASATRPSEVLEEVTGLTWEEVRAERIESGKTSGEIAETRGKLQEYKIALIDFYTERINGHVEDGFMTADEANERITSIKTYIEGATALELNNGMRQGGRRGIGLNAPMKQSSRMNGNFNRGNGVQDGTGAGLRDGFNQGRGLANGTGLGMKDGSGPMCNR